MSFPTFVDDVRLLLGDACLGAILLGVAWAFHGAGKARLEAFRRQEERRAEQARWRARSEARRGRLHERRGA